MNECRNFTGGRQKRGVILLADKVILFFVLSTQAVQKGPDARNGEACDAPRTHVRKQTNVVVTKQMGLCRQPITGCEKPPVYLSESARGGRAEGSPENLTGVGIFSNES